MPTTAIPKKSENLLKRSRNAKNIKNVERVTTKPLSGEYLLDDMKAYHKTVTASPESARAFLTRLGVLTANGKTKKLIRG
jgi:hypothetical protein